MTDWSASVFPVTFVDPALDKKVGRTNFLTEADKMTYEACTYIHFLILII